MSRMPLHTALTALANLTIALVSALYGLLIARFFGADPRATDAFFQAYTLFLMFTIFSSTLRITIVAEIPSPLSNLQSVRRRYAQLGLTVGALFLVLALILAVFSGPLGTALAYGLDSEGRRLAAALVLALAPVVLLQGMGYFLSGALGARRDFAAVSAAMVVSSAAGLALFAAAHGAGIFSVVVGLGCFNGLLTGALWLRARRMGLRVAARDLHDLVWRAAGLDLVRLLRSSAVYLALGAAYLISQSLATPLETGAPTALAFAYSLVAAVVVSTAVSMGQTLAVRYSEKAQSGEEAGAFAAYVLDQAALAVLVLSAVLGALVACAPFAGRLLFEFLPAGSLVAGEGARRAALFTHALAPIAAGGWAMGIFNVLAPAAIAARRQRFFTRFALGALVVHAVLSLILREALGLVGLGVAYALTMVSLALFQAVRLRHSGGGAFLSALLVRCGCVGLAAAVAGWLGSLASVRAASSLGWAMSLPVALGVFAGVLLPASAVIERKAWSALLKSLAPRRRAGD